MPLPIITTSACPGSSLVDRYPFNRVEGSKCQKEDVDFSLGSPDAIVVDEAVEESI
jgi:hypothetical protein